MTRPSPTGAPSLLLTGPDGATQEFTLSKAAVKIGRAPTNDVVLRDPAVSRAHVRLDRTPAGWEVTDLASANGVRVNGAVVDRVLLRPGDLLTIGGSELRLETAEEMPAAEPARIDTRRDVDATMAGMRLPVNLQETGVPRIAISTAEATWEVAMPGDTVTIGRHPASDIVIDSNLVSRHHAVIERRGNRAVLRDLNSSNGTRILGTRVATAPLADGDSFEVGPAILVFKRGFEEEDLTVMRSARSLTARPSVIVVPGFGGSMLWRGSEQVWPAPRMILTQPELLRLEQPLEARGLVDEVVIVPNLLKQDQYSALTDYLKEGLSYETGNDLLEFAYDFRQDNRTSARQLAAAVDGWKTRAPITIIAHSMGCLVARYYVERLGGQARVSRVIYLGGPHAGTPYAFASLVQGPDLLPLGFLNARLRDVLASLPSWYQILPTYPFIADQRSPFAVLDDETWVLDHHRALVRNAREFRAELAATATVKSVCVFGYGLKTITSATVEREAGRPCRKAQFTVTTQGDGMIPEHSGVLAGAEIHPVKQHHGSLYGDSDVKMRLKLELTRGLPA
ncbi:MAG TPA: FHA domain-containing protein [Vicinamibacterales bacterium]|nr:FHA domain-containing protein [Vicinamibacterales bacterium]